MDHEHEGSQLTCPTCNDQPAPAAGALLIDQHSSVAFLSSDAGSWPWIVQRTDGSWEWDIQDAIADPHAGWKPATVLPTALVEQVRAYLTRDALNGDSSAYDLVSQFPGSPFPRLTD